MSRASSNLIPFMLGSVCTALSSLIVAYAIQSAHATGIPTPTPLSYSGTLLTFGQPDNSSHSITAALYLSGTQACTPITTTVTCVNGQFTVPLSSTCTAIVQNNQNVDVEISVDGTAMGQTLLSAVPYAVEAGSIGATGVTGVLAVANGGTGSGTQNFVDLTTNQTIAGNKTFTGDTSFPTAGVGSAATLTLGGADLFNASMQGTFPAVIGGSEGWGTSTGSFACGAPTSINFDVPVPNEDVGIADGWFGSVIWTKAGAFNLSQGNAGQGVSLATTCANLCYGPVTFFLNSPSSQTIVVQGAMDNGPSPIYVNGAIVVPNDVGPISGSGQSVSVPAGNFALSFESCSSDGNSIQFVLSTQFITQYGLSVNYNETFHRNGD